MGGVGRNEPCPCGSGRKFKKCCGAADASHEGNPASEVMDDVREAIGDRVFGSIDEVNLFLNRFMSEKNHAPMGDFEGWSPHRMGRALHAPFDSPDLVDFPDVESGPPFPPVVALFGLLADGLRESDVKATATGNLPRNLCRKIAGAFLGDEGYRGRTRYGGINSETDFEELNTVRLTAELAGFVAKRKGRFHLTKACESILDTRGPMGLFQPLLRVYATRFEWAYRDRWPMIEIVQRSFLFTLYQLTCHGDEWRRDTYYEDAFFRAFPQAMKEWPLRPNPYLSPEDALRSCYTARALDRFAGFFGLAEVEPATPEPLCFDRRIRKTPLLGKAVMFR